MTRSLPNGAQRVQKALSEAGSKLRVELLPETTATANDAARAVGVSVGQIGKSIVYCCDGCAVVAVIPGDRIVDKKLLSSTTGCTNLRRPQADEVHELTGFRIGGVSPFALPSETILIVDESLAEHDMLYVAAGFPRAVVRLNYEDLLKYSGAREGSVTAGG